MAGFYRSGLSELVICRPTVGILPRVSLAGQIPGALLHGHTTRAMLFLSPIIASRCIKPSWRIYNKSAAKEREEVRDRGERRYFCAEDMVVWPIRAAYVKMKQPIQTDQVSNGHTMMLCNNVVSWRESLVMTVSIIDLDALIQACNAACDAGVLMFDARIGRLRVMVDSWCMIVSRVFCEDGIGPVLARSTSFSTSKRGSVFS